tara:strand:+ start:1214 stop:2080 length:867 start_codon:yes stop_codon:yes gene_type:complete
MAETLSIDTTPDSEVLTAEEQDSLEVGQKLNAEHEGKLAGKFDSPKDLENAYLELQKKLGNKEDGIQEEGQKTQEVKADDNQYLEDGSINYETVSEVYGAEVSNIFQNKGIDPWEINKHFHENEGTISDDMYQQLEGAGFSKQLVDAYLSGRAVDAGYSNAAPEADLTDSQVTQIQNSVGGESEYKNIVTWAGQNLSKPEIDAFDSLINSGNVAQIKLAVAGMKAQYQNANGYEGRMLQGKSARTADEVFRSQAELINAMNDPRYETDEAYRDDVMRKLDRSDLKFRK